jgi:ketosteroid isomerase-like protein
MQLRHAVLISLVLAGCASSSETDSSNIPSELATAVPATLRAFQGTDVSPFDALYAENIIVVTPTDRYTGLSDVRTRWLAPFLPAKTDFRSSDLIFTREGNDIIEQGRYSFKITQDGKVQTMRGAFAQRWQRQPDGTWKIVAITVQ